MRSYFSGLWLLTFLGMTFASAIPAPASAANVMFSCWCRHEERRTCNHHLIDSGISETDPTWALAGLAVAPIPIVGTAVSMITGAAYGVETLLQRPELASRRTELSERCNQRCRDDGAGWRAIHFETSYRGEICENCNPDPNSSCTEERGSRLAFGDAQKQALIARCEDAQKASLFPVRLAIPIGGINQVDGLAEYINVAYRYLVTVVLVIAIVMVVYGGFRYLVGASIGDIQAGKKIIVDAIVGMLIVLGAYTILSTVNPATTLLSFTPPPPVECRELELPEAVKNARCETDAQCAEGMRCVEGKNYVFSVQNVAKAVREGAEAGRDVGTQVAEGGGVLGFLGDGVTPGRAALWGGPMGLVGALLSTEAVRQSGVYEAGGAIIGGMIARDAEIISEVRRDIQNLKVCSTGEQGSPCLEDRSCRSGLSCIRSWSICWPGSGNQPGQPCDTDGQCSNGNCVEVGGTEFKVCEIIARETTPCFYPQGATTIFPVQCNGQNMPGVDFVCAWCPPPDTAAARVWTPLAPGLPFPAQCKPRSVMNQPCAR